MGTILVDQLLSACLEQGASELCIRAGRSAEMRLNEGARKLTGPTLVAADVTEIIETITPQRCAHELREDGQTSFDFGFGDAARIHALISQRGGLETIDLHLS